MAKKSQSPFFAPTYEYTDTHTADRSLYLDHQSAIGNNIRRNQEQHRTVSYWLS